MTISEALNKATKKLSQGTSPALDAEVLLSHLLDRPKEYLHINSDKQLSSKIEKQYFELVARRNSGWPVAYIRNNKEFFGLEFYVDKNVLIPRPETEELVGSIIDALKDKSGLNILDIGTGSGCIIISLAKNLARNNQYFASDISQPALRIAKKNTTNHKVKVSFKQSDLLTNWKNQRFNVIVANLPYLTKRTHASTKFEPTNALIAANKGLSLFEKLFKQIPSLKPLPSTLFLEIGHDQSESIKKLAAKLLPAYETKISKDLSGRVRFASLVKKSV